MSGIVWLVLFMILTTYVKDVSNPRPRTVSNGIPGSTAKAEDGMGEICPATDPL